MRFNRGCEAAAVIPAVLILDRVSKCWALASLDAPEAALPGILGFRLRLNTGAAFSILNDSGIIITVITSILLVALAAYIIFGKSASRTVRTALLLVLAGGASNLYDRFAYGGVIDFIELLFVRFAIFNVADIFITLGVIIAAAKLLTEERCKDAA